MPNDFLDTIEDNLERDIDLDLSSFKRQVELDYDFTIPNNNT